MNNGIVLERSLYPVPAIELAIEAFRGVCDVTAEMGKEETHLSFAPHAGAPESVAMEFLSYALCAALEAHLSQSE
jgi:hypothetical protein